MLAFFEKYHIIVVVLIEYGKAELMIIRLQGEKNEKV